MHKEQEKKEKKKGSLSVTHGGVWETTSYKSTHLGPTLLTWLLAELEQVVHVHLHIRVWEHLRCHNSAQTWFGWLLQQAELLYTVRGHE